MTILPSPQRAHVRVHRLVAAGLLAILVAGGARASDFEVFVASQTDGTVRRYDETGTQLGILTTRPYASYLHADDAGSIFVSAYKSRAFYKYSAAGDLLLTVSTPFDVGDIVTSPDGSIFVTDYFGSAIYRYSAAGTASGLFVDLPLTRANYLEIDSSGNLYTTSFPNGVVRRISPAGEDLGNFISGLPGSLLTGGVEGVALDANGNIYVSQTENSIRKYGPDGTSLGVFASTGLEGPQGMDFDPDGNLYVANYGNSTVRKFSPTGEDLGYFVSTGLAGPQDVAVRKITEVAPCGRLRVRVSEVELCWPTVAGQQYRVEYSSTLTGGSWLPLQATNVIGTGASLCLADRVPDGQPARYYRLECVP